MQKSQSEKHNFPLNFWGNIGKFKIFGGNTLHVIKPKYFEMSKVVVCA